MDLLPFRAEVLRSLGAGDREIEELLVYNENVFEHDQAIASLAPEPHVEIWQQYMQDAEKIGVFAALQPRLVQLQFPIQAGISTLEDYRAATRRGVGVSQVDSSRGLQLQAPDRLKLWLHPTLTGPIPVLIAGCRADFVALVQALTRRNEPVPIPDSMGACIVSGYNNWDRVNRYRQQWTERHPECNQTSDWLTEFQALIPQKKCYQDRLIVLSLGPYSNVAATELGLPTAEWDAYSLTIRLEHECTHYCTRRLLNSMRNHLLDELIADYMGIVAAVGRYRSDWFLRFVGLESFPNYRPGGRLENYLGNPKLSDGSFTILQALVKSAAENLERFDHHNPVIENNTTEKLARLMGFTRLTLEELATETSEQRLRMAIARGYEQVVTIM